MNRIRELREANGWTQTQLGKKIDAARNTVSGYETGERQLTPALICKLCDVFECSADYLLGRSDNRIPAFTDDEAELIMAFREAAPNIQASIRLQLDLRNPESKKDAAVS